MQDGMDEKDEDQIIKESILKAKRELASQRSNGLQQKSVIVKKPKQREKRDKIQEYEMIQERRIRSNLMEYALQIKQNAKFKSAKRYKQMKNYRDAEIELEELIDELEVDHIGLPSFIVLLQNLAQCVFNQVPQNEAEESLIKDKVEIVLKQVIQNIEVLQSDYPEVIKSSSLMNLFSFYFSIVSPKMIEFARDKANQHSWFQSLQHDQKAFLNCLRGIAEFFTGTSNYSESRLYLKKAVCQAQSPSVLASMAHNLAVLNYFQILTQNELIAKGRTQSQGNQSYLTHAINQQIKRKAQEKRGENPDALFKNVKAKRSVKQQRHQEIEEELLSEFQKEQIPVDDIRRQIREMPYQIEKQKIEEKVEEISEELKIPHKPQTSRKIKSLAAPLMREVLKSPYFRYQEAKQKGFRGSSVQFKKKLQRMRRKSHEGKIREKAKIQSHVNPLPRELNQVIMKESAYSSLNKPTDPFSFQSEAPIPPAYRKSLRDCAPQDRIAIKKTNGIFGDLELEMNDVTGLLLFALTHFEVQEQAAERRLFQLSCLRSLEDFIKHDQNMDLIQNPKALKTVNFIAEHYLDQEEQSAEKSRYWVNYATKLAESETADQYDKKKAKCLQAAQLLDSDRIDEARDILESLRGEGFHYFRERNLEILCESLLSLILRNSADASEQAEGIVMIETQKAKRKKLSEMHQRLKKLIIFDWTEFMDEREEFILNFEKYL